MWFWQVLEIIGRTFLAIVEALFSLFPVYQQLDNLKTQIIAAVIGVPTIVVSLVFLIPSIIKIVKKLHS